VLDADELIRLAGRRSAFAGMIAAEHSKQLHKALGGPRVEDGVTAHVALLASLNWAG
jgi:hypothetical protein